MELKIPPAVVTLFFGLLIYLLSIILPVGYFDFFGRKVALLALLLLGLLFGGVAVLQFRVKHTTINPSHPNAATNLITHGIYGYTRNPMYLGLLLILIAFLLYRQNAFNTITVALFVYYMNRFQIEPEERILETKFGKPYQLYLKQVRRWF